MCLLIHILGILMLVLASVCWPNELDRPLNRAGSNQLHLLHVVVEVVVEEEEADGGLHCYLEELDDFDAVKIQESKKKRNQIPGIFNKI